MFPRHPFAREAGDEAPRPSGVQLEAVVSTSHCGDAGLAAPEGFWMSSRARSSSRGLICRLQIVSRRVSWPGAPIWGPWESPEGAADSKVFLREAVQAAMAACAHQRALRPRATRLGSALRAQMLFN